jgi:hypothetical protein
MSVQMLPNGVTVATEAKIRGVWFDEKMLHCELQDERVISGPLKWYPRLYAASVAQRNNWELIGGGSGIHREDIDEDLPVRGFLVGCQAPKDKQEESNESFIGELDILNLPNGKQPDTFANTL